MVSTLLVLVHLNSAAASGKSLWEQRQKSDSCTECPGGSLGPVCPLSEQRAWAAHTGGTIPSDTSGFAEQALNSKLCSGNGEAERLCLGEVWRSGVYRRKKTNKKTPPQIAEENPKLNFFISCARNPSGREKNLNS